MFCLEPLKYQDAFLNRCELALAAMEGNENVLSYYKCVYTRSMWFWNTIWPCELKTFVFQLLASLIKKRKKAKIIKKNAKPLNPIIFGLVPFFWLFLTAWKNTWSMTFSNLMCRSRLKITNRIHSKLALWNED